MKKTILFWLMFILAIALAIYFAVKIIITPTASHADLDILATKITARPELRYAAVRALPNGKFATRGDTFQAIAHWTNDAAYYPLTADGTVVKQPSAARPTGGLVFRGILPPKLDTIVGLAGKFAPHIDYLEWIENRRWNIITHTGMTIMMPESDMSGAFNTLATIHNKSGILNKNIKTLDLRDNARILVK